MEIDKLSYNDFNILIIGDSCEDVFIYGTIKRLAPEGPVPVINIEYETRNGGMSLNVSNNIKEIGANSTIITHKEKIYKKRFVDLRTNYLLLRVDEKDECSRISKLTLKNLKDNTYNNVKYDAIVISDYCKGFLLEEDIEFISKNNTNIFLDTKKILGAWCKDVSYIKINQTEYEKTKHTIDQLDINDKLIITKSFDGCEFLGINYPVPKVNIKDVSGAGDTFISGLVCEYVKTKDIIKSIKFAQKCATIVVQKLGVCTI